MTVLYCAIPRLVTLCTGHVADWPERLTGLSVQRIALEVIGRTSVLVGPVA